MNNRDRLLAVIQGKELDRVPFAQYDGIAPNDEAWSLVGRENLGLLRWSAIHHIRHPNCRSEAVPIQRDGLSGERRTLHTPAGDLVEEYVWEPALGTVSRRERFVKEPCDYQVLKAYLEDSVVTENIECFRKDQAELGEDGLPHVSIMRTPFQQMWIEWANLEDLCAHLADTPEIVEECMTLMAGIIRQAVEIARTTDVPYIVFPDNITAPIIGQNLFQRWCVPCYRHAAEMLDVPVFVHMDGDLKPIWQAIGESGVRGIDSFSPPPDNDTSPGEAIEMWPEMRLFVNFPSSVHLAAPEQIRQKADEILGQAGHSGRLVMAISENMPPEAFRKSYPEIVRAVEEFGKP
jgi:hypothetical protein